MLLQSNSVCKIIHKMAAQTDSPIQQEQSNDRRQISGWHVRWNVKHFENYDAARSRDQVVKLQNTATMPKAITSATERSYVLLAFVHLLVSQFVNELNEINEKVIKF